ncbi:MAG: tRNA pseudouridine(38-40) synthase TruA [Steroidobacteraceae bacterium]
MRIAVGIEYHGAAYRGWQLQPHAPSVQHCLQRALATVADAPVELTCAGRTDAGVHARGQVAHFDTGARRNARAWVLGANSHLPPDISLTWAMAVPEHFHARYSATARSYRYLILNRQARSALAGGRALCVHRPLDAERMQTAGADLIGEHDFSAFRAAGCQSRSPVRRLTRLQVQRQGEWLAIDVSANAFLHHMVRNIVGLLLAIGTGDEPVARARQQLESRQRSLGEATAAAHGLYFWRVHYPAQFGLPDDSAIIDVPEQGISHVLV